MSENKNIEKMEKVSDKNLEEVAAGMYYRMYTCISPGCSEYLNYLEFQPEGNKCPVCGGPIGGVV